MHILYMHRGYFPALAGAEAMARLVASKMQQRGHTVQLVCQSRDGAFQDEQLDGLPFLGTPTLNVQELMARLPWRPDIVHAVDAVWPDFPQAALELAQVCGVPLAFTPASTISVWEDVPATLAVCRAAGAVFVLTEAERALFQAQGVATERMVVIGQGPNLVGTPDPEGFRRSHGIEGPLVLFLGRKVAFKGYRQLLAAAPAVWERCPQAVFAFVGPPWDADCQEVFQAHADRRIIEIGIVDDIEKHSALAACDLLCLPSSADVFPLVFVEAWSCGKPVIASPFPGIAEIVHDGEDGLIVEADPPALALAISALLEDPERRAMMGAVGMDRVRREFNWEVVTDRIESAYLRLRAQ